MNISSYHSGKAPVRLCLQPRTTKSSIAVSISEHNLKEFIFLSNSVFNDYEDGYFISSSVNVAAYFIQGCFRASAADGLPSGSIVNSRLTKSVNISSSSRSENEWLGL